MDLNNMPAHSMTGVYGESTQQLLITLSAIVNCPRPGIHSCDRPDTDEFVDCDFCQETAIFHQLLMNLLERVCPEEHLKIAMPTDDDKFDWGEETVADEVDTDSNKGHRSSDAISPVVDRPHTEPKKVASPLTSDDGKRDQRGLLRTACVEEQDEEAEYVAIMASEEIESATAEAITLTETDVGLATCQVIAASLDIKGSAAPIAASVSISHVTHSIEASQFWQTSLGKFRFSLRDLPGELQLIHAIMQNVEQYPNPDVIYFLLHTLKYLCLHAGALNNARREHRGFLVWAQENVLIPKLWTLLRSDYSQIAEICVPLLMHCATQSSGEEMFWKVVNEDFTSRQWKRRFAAVEKTSLLSQFLGHVSLRTNRVLQSCLSSAFCHLIASVHDPCAVVSQRALLYVQAIPARALTTVCSCLESHFDRVIVDRPIVLHRLHLLTTLLPNQAILSWDFFLHRFDILAIEPQLRRALSAGESVYVQDLLHSDQMSDSYQRKITRARHALETYETARSMVRCMAHNAMKHQNTLNFTSADENGNGNQNTVLNLHSQEGSYCSLDSEDTHPQGLLREFTDVESNLCLLLNRTMDRENPERCTVFLIFRLFMTFLSSTTTALIGSDERTSVKKQSLVIRHLNTLLGFSNAEKCFTIPPSILRHSAICNAFLAGLPSVLDSNLLLGKQILPIAFQLLYYLPSPRKLASDHQTPDFTLWTLQAHVRHSWLWSTLIVLYKYHFDLPPIDQTILNLILVILSTLEAQVHRCTSLFHSISTPGVFQSDSSSESDEAENGGKYEITKKQQTSRETIKENDESFSAQINGEFEVSIEPRMKISTTSTPITNRIRQQIDAIDRSFEKPTQKSIPFESLDLQSRLIRLKSLNEIQPIEIAETGTIIPLDSKTIEFNHSQDVLESIVEESPLDMPRKKEEAKSNFHVRSKSKSSTGRFQPRPIAEDDQALVLRCTQCNRPLESFDEETLSMAIVCLSTFVRRQPTMAAEFLPRLLEAVADVAGQVHFPWQAESEVFVPGNTRSVARQCLRVVLHQLSGNGVFLQLFQTRIHRPCSFWTTISTALFDFQELGPVTVVQILLEVGSNHLQFVRADTKLDLSTNWPSNLNRILYNLSSYIVHTPKDVYLTTWSTVVGLLDGFFRRYLAEIGQKVQKSELNSSIVVMNTMLKVQNFPSIKGSVSLVESFSKWLVHCFQTAVVRIGDLMVICTSCTRVFTKERDRQIISRACVVELIQAIKFKSILIEENYISLMNLILYDTGEVVSAELDDFYTTGASDCAQPYLADLVEFIADLHVLNRLKNLGTLSGNSRFIKDTLGGDLKAGFAQFLAVEISRANVRDPKTVLRYLPWLLSPPSITQQGPVEFANSVTRVRVLSWLLLGALQSTSVACLPIPVESSHHIADYIQFVLAGFAEQSKASVVHMSALFHAFHLCQLWTIYCEQAADNGEAYNTGCVALTLDFWARVTPSLLQLLSHSKMLADMVNLHFLNTIQALQECQSAILSQLYPMWQPILTAYHVHIPSQLRMKLDSCENDIKTDEIELGSWLKRVRYKISQVELQTSVVSPFYNV